MLQQGDLIFLSKRRRIFISYLFFSNGRQSVTPLTLNCAFPLFLFHCHGGDMQTNIYIWKTIRSISACNIFQRDTGKRLFFQLRSDCFFFALQHCSSEVDVCIFFFWKEKVNECGCWDWRRKLYPVLRFKTRILNSIWKRIWKRVLRTSCFSKVKEKVNVLLSFLPWLVSRHWKNRFLPLGW